MGLFGGRDDGLYRGDAPVSVPGAGGSGPRPYDTSAASVRASDRSGIGAAADAERELRQSRRRSRQTARTEARAMRPAGSANVPMGVVSKKTSSAGTWIGFGALLVVILAAALVVRSDWWSDRPATVDVSGPPAGDPDAAGLVPDPPEEVSPAIDVDVSGDDDVSADDGLVLDYDGAELRFVVWIGALHGHGTWAAASPATTPSLVVEVDITRLDGGAEPVTLDEWNWRVDTPGGPGAWPTTVAGASPSLVGATLASGDTASGYLTFPVGSPDVTLVFTEGLAGDDLATWEFTAWSPEVIDAASGDAIRPEVGQPPFRVTVTGAQSTAAADPRFGWPSQSGRYLTFTLDIDVDDDAAGLAGFLSTDNFSFVTDDGQHLDPVYGVTEDGLRQIVLEPRASTTAEISFDSDAVAGVLELRDGAGTLAVRWPAGNG